MARPVGPRRYRSVVLLLLGLLPGPGLAAQSLTGGALRGEVITADGIPVPGVTVTLEDQGGLELRQLTSDARGQFTIPLLAPGRYSVLAERSGFQPLRQRGIEVVAEALTVVWIRVERRPPPITSVVEVEIADQRLTSNAPRVADLLGRGPEDWGASRAEVSADARSSARVATPFDTRPGFAVMIAGLPQSRSRLLVDGLPGSWTRHPGIEPEPGTTPALPRFLVQQAILSTNAGDAEWAGGNGGTLGVVSRQAGPRFRFEPFGFYSGSIGTPSSLNPADSSATSFLAGATFSGTVVPGKATYIAGFAYEQVETPTDRPWEVDTARLNGATVNFRSALETQAGTGFGRAMGGQTNPVVRGSRGGVGGLRVDWRLSPAWVVTTRASLSRYKERNPSLAADLSNGAGTRLDLRDFFGGTTVSYARGPYANEFRLGFRSTQRDWATGGLPATVFAAEGAGIGGLPALPGMFRHRTLDFANTFQLVFGPRDVHRFKVGVQYSSGFWTQDHLPGEGGSYAFGNLDGFEDLRGSFMVAEAAGTRVRYKLIEAALFGQVTWQLRPTLDLLAGLRYDRQKFPLGQSEIRQDQAFGNAFGLPNSVTPNDKNNVAPRLGLSWNPGTASPWAATVLASRNYGQLNPARFAEAVLHDGPVSVRRAVGDLGSWPALPDSTVAARVGRRFTLFDPGNNYKNPRTTKVDAELSRSLGRSGRVRVSGGYHHTDFLLRRTDLNLLSAPTGLTQEGREVYGVLAKEGGLVAATPGSNRRVVGYDMVSALASDGFQDYYEAGITASTEVAPGLVLSGRYLWSKTRDNWLQSWTGNPEDELSPFAGQRPGNEWAEGISDYDIPHRAVVEGTWRSRGRLPLTVGARYRIRSGLPFTPGFRPGVDANADGSGRNDPGFLDPAIAGMPALLARNPCLDEQAGRFAERNSCREGTNHALDLSVSVLLPVETLGGRLELMVDAFNVAASANGYVDRAVVLVDPAGTLTSDPQGNVTLPLVANPHFGKLQSRRTDPRVVRLGLRLAY